MAIPNKTYNEIIDKLKSIGEKHEQISTVTTGDIFDIDLEKNTKYALMHINPVNVVTARYGLTYNFQIFVMDLVEPDNSNEQQVYSTVLQICVDLISIFRNSKYQSSTDTDINLPIYFTEGDFTLEPFTERFDQAVTGWVFQIGVNVDNSFQTCEIPMQT
jgi:hypothetical protein|tara:strand:+ start:152 stop:631 length:480 start_codon:yes stop_codon:yes gene_type:complete